MTFFIFTAALFAQTKDIINVNNIELPIENNGVLADVTIDSTYPHGGIFKKGRFLFSGGFFISGYTDTLL